VKEKRAAENPEARGLTNDLGDMREEGVGPREKGGGT